jgi:hypothetical protein
MKEFASHFEMIIQWPSKVEEPIACTIGLALWQKYTRRNPDGLKMPPEDLMNCTDPELMPYVLHVTPAIIAMRSE